MNKRKQTKAIVVLICLSLWLASLAHATGVRVQVNGVDAELEVPPINVEGTVLVPVRFVADLFEATTEWEAETETVTVLTEEKVIQITIGNNKAVVLQGDGSREVELEQPAQIYENKTMLPIRFLSDEFEADIDWIDESKTVTIQSERAKLVEKPQEDGSGENAGDGDNKEDKPQTVCTAWRYDPLTGPTLYTRIC